MGCCLSFNTSQAWIAVGQSSLDPRPSTQIFFAAVAKIAHLKPRLPRRFFLQPAILAMAAKNLRGRPGFKAMSKSVKAFTNTDD